MHLPHPATVATTDTSHSANLLVHASASSPCAASPVLTAHTLAVHLVHIVQRVHCMRLLVGCPAGPARPVVALAVRVVHIAQLFLCKHLLACLTTSSTASSACYSQVPLAPVRHCSQSLVHCNYSLVLVIPLRVQCIHSLIQIKRRKINHIHSLIHIGQSLAHGSFVHATHSHVHTATSLSPRLLVHRKHALVLLDQWLVHGSLALLPNSHARAVLYRYSLVNSHIACWSTSASNV